MCQGEYLMSKIRCARAHRARGASAPVCARMRARMQAILGTCSVVRMSVRMPPGSCQNRKPPENVTISNLGLRSGARTCGAQGLLEGVEGVKVQRSGTSAQRRGISGVCHRNLCTVRKLVVSRC